MTITIKAGVLLVGIVIAYLDLSPIGDNRSRDRSAPCIQDRDPRQRDRFKKACQTGRYNYAHIMTRPDSKTYQTLPFVDQAATVLAFMADSGHAVREADKFAADCSGDRGRALQRARVTGTAWKTASVIPTAIRRDYPRLVAFAAMEEAFLAADKAATAARAVNAME